MGAYILRRLLLVIPTLLGIMIINFALVQFVPGGPIEQILANLEGRGDVFESFSGGAGDADFGTDNSSEYVGARGLPPEFIAQLEREFGFDKPPLERFLNMMWNYMRFDFGDSYFRSISVFDLVLEKMPVSITLGLWSTLIAYLISIPLGIKKAVRDGTPVRHMDQWRDHHRLRDPRFPVCDPADRTVCRWVVLPHLPVARADLIEFRGSVADRQDPRLPLAHHATSAGLDDFGLCDADLADEKQLSGRD